MNISHEDYIAENEYLKGVIAEIDLQVDELKNKLKATKTDIIKERKYMWEDLPHIICDDLIQACSYTAELEHDYSRSYKGLVRLEKMRLSPFFGRIDFLEKGDSIMEKIYIGILTLKDKSHKLYVYDWRSPIAGMFYDFELGDAYFICPEGKIEGCISLKRQYKIVNGEFERLFNSDVKIDDDMLQYILCKNVDDKMKTIVTTIQREQNAVIRDTDHKLLIVQGCAGSGKTSIALHRIAYLLYKYKSTINSNNIVIFSPNDLFNDYISDVIPELGEDSVYQITFRDYSMNMLDSAGYYIEDIGDQIEYLITESNREARAKLIKFKSDIQFAEIIKGYVTYLENEGLIFEDFKHNNYLIISGDEIKTLFYNTFGKFVIGKRFLCIYDEIKSRLDNYKKNRRKEVFEALEKENSYTKATELKAMARIIVAREMRYLYDKLKQSTTLIIPDIYYRLLADKDLFIKLTTYNPDDDLFNIISINASECMKNKYIAYEDIPPILLLNTMLGYRIDTTSIKHVIIDEAQDYSPIQYEVFRQLFPKASFMLLGDVNQRISLYGGISEYHTVLDVFGFKSNRFVELKKSFRSTKEIFDLCNKALDGTADIEHIGRSGEQPMFIKALNENIMYKLIADDIIELMHDKMDTLAIICKTAQESQKVFTNLRQILKSVKINLVTKDTTIFTKGILVIPSYLSKGLEFDAVIAYDISNHNYSSNTHLGLLYVTLTRALHKLHIYYTGDLSKLLKVID